MRAGLTRVDAPLEKAWACRGRRYSSMRVPSLSSELRPAIGASSQAPAYLDGIGACRSIVSGPLP